VFVPGSGYVLGTKSLGVGHQARTQFDILRVARPHLEALAEHTGDTIHLAVIDGTRALYLEKIPGRRRVEISSRVGELQPLRSTGLGKALLLDHSEAELREFYRSENINEQDCEVSEAYWLQCMKQHASLGYAFDLEEDKDQIRCVAAPIRGAMGAIGAAISASSAAQYLDDLRMPQLAREVCLVATQISKALGSCGERPNGDDRRSVTKREGLGLNRGHLHNR
jgi:DNA-binding IclR family transcriptional regulator